MIETRQSKVQSFAFVLSQCFCIALTVGIVTSHFIGYKSSLCRCDIALDDKINPNDATVASLARLPNIGLVRAQAIVAYRDQFRIRNSDNWLFQDCNDLQNVKGIGPKTAQNISKWLKFE